LAKTLRGTDGRTDRRTDGWTHARTQTKIIVPRFRSGTKNLLRLNVSGFFPLVQTVPVELVKFSIKVEGIYHAVQNALINHCRTSASEFRSWLCWWRQTANSQLAIDSAHLTNQWMFELSHTHISRNEDSLHCKVCAKKITLILLFKKEKKKKRFWNEIRFTLITIKEN
jgi:hypothetical protein